MWTSLPPGNSADRFLRATQHHHLATCHALRLDENRVHAHVRLRPRSDGLKILRDPNLASLHYASVVGHVLRLEGRHSEAAASEVPAEGGGDEALACPARRSLHHQSRHVTPPMGELRSCGAKRLPSLAKVSPTSIPPQVRIDPRRVAVVVGGGCR